MKLKLFYDNFMNSAAVKILRTLLCILTLCAYAGCSSISTNSMSQTSTSQEVIKKLDNGKPQNLPMKNLEVTGADGVTFNLRVQVADTMATRVTGLMFRKEMPDDEGMVFLFENTQPLNFWMKNTLIPLDIIYLSEDWEVVSIQKNAQPCKADPCVLYPSSQNSKYVLEINGGLSDKLGIRKGTAVRLQ